MDEISNKNHEPVVMYTKFGSHLYGLSTPDSDTDYKGIFLPNRDDLLLQRAPRTQSWSTGDNNDRNTSEDVDNEFFALHEFVRQALKGETVAIDMLHAWQDCGRYGFMDRRHLTYVPNDKFPIWRDLVENRTSFYTSSMKSYLGYVRKQAAKYGVKGSRLECAEQVLNKMSKLVNVPNQTVRMYEIMDLLPQNEHAFITEKDGKEFYSVCERLIEPTAKINYAYGVVNKIVDNYGERAKQARDNKGIDWKAISHALRGGYQMRHILKYGDFDYPLPESDHLLKVKHGELDFQTNVKPELEALVENVNKLAEQTSLPAHNDHKSWNQWVIDVYDKYVIGVS